MALLHDSSTIAHILRRIQSLRPDSRTVWGKMSVDRMLWHVNKVTALSLGQVTVGSGFPPLPSAILKYMVLTLPWIKGASTHPEFVAKVSHDFDAERERLLRLIREVAAKPLTDSWPRHPAFGQMTGKEVSQLVAKHIDHHLQQFGA